MADRRQPNRENRTQPYDRTKRGDQNRSTGDSSGTSRKDINRRYADRWRKLKDERSVIEEEQNPDGKSRYEEYCLIAENLGRLAAEGYRLTYRNEAISSRNPMMIHATRQEIFANRETNTNEYNALASEFQEYLPFARKIHRFNEDVEDHNAYCPRRIRIEEIQDHLKLMNEAFNDEMGNYLEIMHPPVDPFTEGDWNVNPVPPPTPPRRSDGHDSSDTSSSNGHNGSDTNNSDTNSSDTNSSDTSSSDIDID